MGLVFAMQIFAIDQKILGGERWIVFWLFQLTAYEMEHYAPISQTTSAAQQ